MSLAPRALSPTSPGTRLLRATAGAGALAFALLSTPATAGITHAPASTTMPSIATEHVAAATTHAVTLQGYMFMPATMTVHVGDTITWTNHDSAAHNIVAKSGASFHSPLIGKGQSFSWTATSSGSVSYVCSLHPGMDAQLSVLPAISTGTASTGAAATGTASTGTASTGTASTGATTPSATAGATPTAPVTADRAAAQPEAPAHQPAANAGSGAATVVTAPVTPAAAAPTARTATLDPMLIVVAIVVATVVFCLLLITGGGTSRRARTAGVPDSLPPGWVVVSADQMPEQLQSVDGGRR